MGESWLKASLGTLTTKIGSGATPRGGSSVYTSDGVSFIRSQNVYDSRFESNGLVHIDDAAAADLNGVAVQAGDILLNITGDSVARCCIAPRGILPARVSQHVMIIRPHPEMLDSRYLQGLLVEPQMKSYLLTLAGAGATRPALTKDQIARLEVLLAPLSEQRAIAEVLGALDDKIEANHHVIQMAWSLAAVQFQSITERDEVQFVRLGEVAKLSYGKSLPEHVREPGVVPVFGSGGVVGHHSAALVIGPGVIVGRKGTAGAVHWCQSDFFPIDTTFYVRSDELPMEFLYFVLRWLGLEHMNSDSAVPGLNRSAALARLIPLPKREELDAFTRVASPLTSMVAAIERESEALTAMRDALLPKLLSGELRVKDAEPLVETAL